VARRAKCSCHFSCLPVGGGAARTWACGVSGRLPRLQRYMYTEPSDQTARNTVLGSTRRGAPHSRHDRHRHTCIHVMMFTKTKSSRVRATYATVFGMFPSLCHAHATTARTEIKVTPVTHITHPRTTMHLTSYPIDTRQGQTTVLAVDTGHTNLQPRACHVCKVV